MHWSIAQSSAVTCDTRSPFHLLGLVARNATFAWSLSLCTGELNIKSTNIEYHSPAHYIEPPSPRFRVLRAGLGESRSCWPFHITHRRVLRIETGLGRYHGGGVRMRAVV